jgi:hypothetical protein
MGLIFSSKCVLERLRVVIESGVKICIQVRAATLLVRERVIVPDAPPNKYYL